MRHPQNVKVRENVKVRASRLVRRTSPRRGGASLLDCRTSLHGVFGRGRRGFTLLEAVLAAAIGGLVLLVLFQGFSMVVQGHRRIYASSDARARLFARLLSDDLLCAYIEEDADVPLSLTGRGGEVCLVRSRPLGVLADADAPDDLMRVCYVWSPSRSGDGTLRRQVRATDVVPQAPPREERVLMTGLRDMRWAFYDGTQWAAAWDSSQQLPRLVRVTFSTAPPKGRTRNYEMVFDVPGA